MSTLVFIMLFNSSDSDSEIGCKSWGEIARVEIR